jgi:serine/threonine-protein kinase
MRVLSPGDRFGGYVVDGILGRGGFATVYRAHRTEEPNHAVALKVLDEQHRHQAQVARLRREFEIAHRLRHRNIVTVYARGPGWLTMELVVGGSVAELASMANRIVALSQIADALDYAHNRAVVHCDVKPANILVHSEDCRAVLVDFGVAYTPDDAGQPAEPVEVSLPYSAPELIAGRTPTDATDEYALACTAVELITGSPPFPDDSRMALIDAHLHRPPPRRSAEIPWLPRVFDLIVAKAMAKEPTDRYRSCKEFVALMSRALQ